MCMNPVRRLLECSRFVALRTTFVQACAQIVWDLGSDQNVAASCQVCIAGGNKGFRDIVKAKSQSKSKGQSRSLSQG